MATDPRRVGPAETVDERLLRRGIRHSVLVNRLAAGASNRFVDALEERALERVAGVTLAGYRRLPRAAGERRGSVERTAAGRRLLARVRRVGGEGVAEAAGELRREALEAARAEASWAASMLDQETGLPIASADARRLSGVLTRVPIRGELFSARVATLQAGLARRVAAVLNVGLTRGLTVREVSNLLLESGEGLAATRREARVLARTALIHTTAQAREDVYEANGDLLQGVRWVATLDMRICPACLEQDGRVYPTGEGPRPPLHLGDRCATVPQLKSASQLARVIGERPQRSSEFTGRVPGNVTATDWFRGLSQKDQEEILGPTKVRLFREEGVPLERLLTDRNLEPLTVEEIIRREGVPPAA